MKKLLATICLFSCFSITAADDVQAINSLDEFDKVYQSNKPLAIKFSASWCGACNQMDPRYSNVAKKKSDVTFYNVDVSEKALKPLIKKHKIEGLPTTVFVTKGKELRRERGCMTEADLEKSVDRFSELLKRKK